MSDTYEVISAFLDDEPFDSSQLALGEEEEVEERGDRTDRAPSPNDPMHNEKTNVVPQNSVKGS